MSKAIPKMICYIGLSLIPYFFIMPPYNTIWSWNLNQTLLLSFIIFYATWDIKYTLIFIPPMIISPNYFIIFTLVVAYITKRLIKARWHMLILGIILQSLYSVFVYNYQSIHLSLLLALFLLYILVMLSMLQTIKFYQIENTITKKIVNYDLLIATFIMCLMVISSRTTVSVYIIIPLLILSTIVKKEYTFLLGLLSYLLTKSTITLIIPFITIIPYSSILITLAVFIDTFTTHFIDNASILFSLLLAGLLRLIFYNKKAITPIYHIYDNVVENFNHQILKFASFLDEYEKNFISNPEQTMRLTECCTYIINTICLNCQSHKLCMEKQKPAMYTFIKSAIAYGKDIYVKGNYPLNKEFIKYCPYADNIINQCNQFKNKYHITKEKCTSEKLLETQIKGLSNTLRHFATDLTTKRELNLYTFIEIRQFLNSYGYNIILYDVKKTFTHDFLVEIGLENVTKLDAENIIKDAIEGIIKMPISIIINDIIDSIIYFSIIPKIKFNIQYGYAALAKDNENLQGDNYLIKPVKTGSFLAALSDGMGTGYKAHLESKLTLELIDKISGIEINTHTAINMLNTFYSLRDNMDQYATLDLFKINQSTGNALIYKMGSATSFLIRDEQIATINNRNLPFGMSDLITYDEFIIQDNDIFVLASDGITDYLSGKEFDKLLLAAPYKNPQKTAYDILNLQTNNTIRDDMSIIVLRIEKVS